jgi:NDP-sugar pyrophosphorylase family protein
MVVMPHPEAGNKYGAVWVDDQDCVVGIGRTKPDVTCIPYHFVGIHLLEESIFKHIPDGPCEITTHVYLPAIKKGDTVLAFKKEGLWFDAGSLEDYLQATQSLFEILPRLQHQPYFLSLFRRFWPNFDRRPNLWEGEGCEHLLSLGAQNKILMGARCKIHPTVKVSGFAVFGSDVIIEKNVEIHNSVVASGVTVKSGAKLKNTLML